MGLLQTMVNNLAKSDPARWSSTAPVASNPGMKTADEVRLASINNYQLAGSQAAMGRVTSGQQAPSVPTAIGTNGKVITWTPQTGSVTHDIAPADIAIDPDMTPNWQRAPVVMPSAPQTTAPGGALPTDPAGPTSPTTPESPTTPTAPGSPTTPTTPVTPGAPSVPSVPGTGTGGTVTTQTAPSSSALERAATQTASTSLLNLGNIPQATARTATAANAGDAATWEGKGYDATSATAASAGDAYTLDKTTTVQGLLGQIMAQDNPLMQQARTMSQQQMASRGLLNSSMAIGAGQDALYRVAMPIAQQDAQAYNNTDQFNAQAKNNMSQYNASNQQQTALANMQAQNAASQYGAEALNQSAAQNAQAQNQIKQYNASNEQQVALANAQARNSMNQFNAGNQFSAQQANMQAQNNMNQFNAQQTNAQGQFNATQTNDLIKTQLEFGNRTQLANIEASYKTLMQANQSAGDLYQQTVKNITDIQSNADMEPDTKASAIANQLSYLQTGLNILGKMNNISGLQELLTFY